MDPIQARDRIDELSPDAITLDLEMPREDGLTFLRHLFAERPIPTVVLSALIRQNPRLAMECLEAGAIGVLEKPQRADDFPAVIEELSALLAGCSKTPMHPARIRSNPRAFDRTVFPAADEPSRPGRTTDPAPDASDAGVPIGHRTGPPLERRFDRERVSQTQRDHSGEPAPPADGARSAALPAEAPRVRSPKVSHPPHQATPEPIGTPNPATPRTLSSGPGRPLVVIGSSTGGTEVLRSIMSQLPATAPAILVVQHMPPEFTAAFAERLDQVSSLEVREAAEGDRVMPGRVLIAPGARHLALASNGDQMLVRIEDGPPIDHHRPSVARLFNTTCMAATGPVLAVMLTGMGNDGADAMLRLRQHGAKTVAQCESSCVVYGMPRAAMHNGGAAAAADPAAITAMIAAFGRSRHASR